MESRLLLWLVLAVFIGVLMFLPQMTHTVTEVSCSKDGVWLRFSLADELTTLQNQIADCRDDPTGGWVGSMMVYATTPAGNQHKLGGYTVLPNSTEKISCGGGNIGKYFVGGYVPLEGQGKYEMKAVIIAYSSSDNYKTPHRFEFTRSGYAYCPTFKAQCEDGTPIYTCSDKKPFYCDQYGSLNSQPSRCGCPAGTIPEKTVCVVFSPVQPVQPTQPTPTITTPDPEIPANPLPETSETQDAGTPIDPTLIALCVVVALIWYIALFGRR